MKIKAQILSTFAEAWEYVLDFSMPKFLSVEKEDKVPVSDYAIAMTIPAVGLVMALVLLIGFKVASAIFSEIGVAIVFAIIATLFCEAKESGRGSSLLVATVNAIAKSGFKGILYGLPHLKAPRFNELVGTLSTVVLIAIELVKIAGFFILALNGKAAWIVAVLVLPFAVQGFLMALPDFNRGKPFLKIAANREAHIGIVTLVIMLFLALCMPKMVLVALILSSVIALLAKRFFVNNYGGTTAEMITLTGTICEILMILCGVLFI